MSTEMPETSGYGRVPVIVSAVVGVVVSVLSVWWASGFAIFYEELFRVAPTVEGGGVGADWIVGNTVPWLDFLVALTHAADAIMGVFILFMVFLHWAAFRRLAGRMRAPDESRGAGVATDGGEAGGGASSARGPDGGEPERASDGGERP
jgi:hypothetical protein